MICVLATAFHVCSYIYIRDIDIRDIDIRDIDIRDIDRVVEKQRKITFYNELEFLL